MSDSQLLIAPRRRGSQTGRAAILTVVAAILVASLAVPVRAWFNQRDEIVCRTVRNALMMAKPA